MAIIDRVVSKIFGDPQAKIVKGFQARIDKVNAFEPEIESLSDDALKAKTDEFRHRIAEGTPLDALLPEAFAVVREASKRTLGMRHFDVQLVGGIVLHEGRIAEMKTGEGKTLCSTLPAYLNALEGKGVYIVTVNDYLAARDSEWMGQVHRFLGLTVGLIQSGMESEEKVLAYQCDITYGTNNEFGFDYLRDNMAWDVAQCCQLRRHYAIIDEVDSILIDEARTPLIISGPIQDSTAKYVPIADMIRSLQVEADFTLDEKHKNVVLTEEGIIKIEKAMGLENVFSVKNMDVAHMAVQCLKAKHLFKRDVDYVVKDGEVQIVDEFTGRLLEGRRYSDGLHQAIEAVENLEIKEESQTLASVTFQNYFRLFPKLAGMTGTAVTEGPEFEKIYGLSVVVIPTNKPLVRDDRPDVVYKTTEEKFKAIVGEIQEAHKTKQPVLVGTISIENSERISELLKKQQVPHNVLNAKFHEKEAEIVANAGQPGSVTIATNMAGRGTDIVLGEGVKEVGGLYVMGSERHESRRIDNQLRGRSGRQGDPGKSRFFVSLQDDLMRLFGADRIAKVMDALKLPADTPIEHKMVSRSIEKAQTKVEKYHFGVRKQILEYDDVLNKQRETIYTLRYQVLEKRDLDKKVAEGIEDVLTTMVVEVSGEEMDEAEVKSTLSARIQQVFPISNIDEVALKLSKEPEAMQRFVDSLNKLYLERKNTYQEGIFEEFITKRMLLVNLDRKWMDHLHNMDVLREGIGLRAWGQRDPLLEYKREGFDMFQDLILSMYEEALSMIFRAELVEKDQEKEDAEKEVSKAFPKREMNLSHGKKEVPKKRAPAKNDEKVGRNDPCPCGSGKKFKKCCMT
ncbi:MAG: preprotein translocase subunit SecA [Candidatus Marinamargulisbacteria bacterium]|jgi:preprotein translocase subunit SecA